MITRAWRIVKAKHAATAFTGDGAREYGGRWNSSGTAMVYAAGSMSLAILEMLVHLGSQDSMKGYVAFEVTFGDSLVTAVDVAALPKNWRKSPPPLAMQHIGDAWAASGKSAVLRVPSVVVPGEYNYLFNPAHKDFGAIKIGAKRPAKIDPRL